MQKKFFCHLCLLPLLLFLSAEAQANFSCAGIDSTGKTINFQPGFYQDISGIFRIQLGLERKMTGRFPAEKGGWAIHQYQLGNNSSIPLIPAELSIPGFGSLTRYAYIHRSSNDFRRHFILIQFETGNNSITGTSEFEPRLYCHHPEEYSRDSWIRLDRGIKYDNARIALSPDSSKLLVYDGEHSYFFTFTRSQDNNNEISWQFLESATSELLQKSSAAALTQNALFFIADSKLQHFDWQTGSTLPLGITVAPGLYHNLHISTDGQRLILNDRNPVTGKMTIRAFIFSKTEQIYVEQNLPFINPGREYYDPSLTANGRFLIFITDNTENATASENRIQIFRWDFRTYDLTPVISPVSVSSEDHLGSPQLSPDGTIAAFVSSAEEHRRIAGISPGVHQIFVRENIPCKNGNEGTVIYQLLSYDYGNNPVTANETYRSVQTDATGEKVVFTTNARLTQNSPGESNAFLRNVITGNLEVLQGNVSHSAISGDGKTYCVSGNDSLTVFLPQEITIQARTSHMPLLSENGHFLLYLNQNSRQLIRRNLKNSEDTILYTYPGEAALPARLPAQISADGQTVLYGDGKTSLMLWTAVNGKSHELPISGGTSGIQTACMSAYGSIIYYKTDEGIFRYDRISHKKNLMDTTPNGRLQCSGNGRYLLFYNQAQELCRKKLNSPSSIISRTELAYHSETINFTGNRIFFNSAGNGNSVIQGNNLYMAALPQDTNTPPVLVVPAAQTICNYAPTDIYFTYEDADGDDAFIRSAEVISNNAIADIISPNSAASWYGIRITRTQDSLNPVILRITVSDGQSLSRPAEVRLAVQNSPLWKTDVPDLITLSISENETILLSPTDYAADPNGDPLKFSFETQPDAKFISLDSSGCVVLSPDSTTVQKPASGVFSCRLKITDAFGLSTSVKTLKISVQDINQPPKIALKQGYSSILATPNPHILAKWLECSDIDPEDKNLPYEITFAISDNSSGLLNCGQRSGKRISIPLSTSDEIHYMPGGSSADLIAVTCSNGKVSSPIYFTWKLENISFSLNSVWWTNEQNPPLPSQNRIQIQAGTWSLLSLPITVSAEVMLDSQTFGPQTILQYWNPEKQCYQKADRNTLLPAGTGFWLYPEKIPTFLPEINAWRQTHNRNKFLRSGWHLLGPIQGLSGDSMQTILLFPQNLPAARYQAPVFLKPNTSYIPPTGTAAWIYQPAAQ